MIGQDLTHSVSSCFRGPCYQDARREGDVTHYEDLGTLLIRSRRRVVCCLQPYLKRYCFMLGKGNAGMDVIQHAGIPWKVESGWFPG